MPSLAAALASTPAEGVDPTTCNMTVGDPLLSPSLGVIFETLQTLARCLMGAAYFGRRLSANSQGNWLACSTPGEPYAIPRSAGLDFADTQRTVMQ